MSRVINYLQVQLGKFIFSLLEPIFQFWENQGTNVRIYLRQGLNSLDKEKTAVALLNLNMVLSLKPNHFLALINRGRLYLKESRFQFAVQDFLKASRVSAYRFHHYGLNIEYFQSVNKDVNDLDTSTGSQFSGINKSLSVLNDEPEEQSISDVTLLSRKNLTIEQGSAENNENAPDLKRLYLGKLDREKFDKFGPITQQEIDNTDWDQLIQDFTS